MAHDVQDFVSDAGHRDTLNHPAQRNDITTPPCDQQSDITMAAAPAHPLSTAPQTNHTTQHSTLADQLSRTLVHAYADGENHHENAGCLMQSTLESQIYNCNDDCKHDEEGGSMLSDLDSQSHTTTVSCLSDLESCSWVLQHASVMQICDAAVSVVLSDMDASDPLGLLQSESPEKKTSKKQPTS
eukprot:2573998-Amphidinium_carterae.1